MINAKYYADMQGFTQQFSSTFEVSLPETFPQQPRIVLCGMGGSALYIPLVQDLLNHHAIDIRLESCSTYSLPAYNKENTVVVCASYSGNTEETIHCLQEAKETGAHTVVFTTGGKLLDMAQQFNLTTYQIPSGLQPRLSTGYFIVALLDLLSQLGYQVTPILSACQSTSKITETQQAQDLANNLLGKTPIIYTTDVLKSMALISKIKINENSKTPAFAHYIPELNHNEMCGRMGHTLEPHFIIFSSQFTHVRNLRRIEVMKELFTKEGYPITIITPQGNTLAEETLRIYQFMDYVSYYLAEAQGIDPEPVQMVEDFKAMLG